MFKTFVLVSLLTEHASYNELYRSAVVACILLKRSCVIWLLYHGEIWFELHTGSQYYEQ